jgi:hypothetical protein
MRKSLSILLIPALALGGCAVFGSQARGGGGTPDEFAVARNAPLVIPPDFTLTPPAAGTVTNGPENAQQQAIQVLFGGPAARSASERTMLEQAGRDQASLGIRSTAGSPDTNVADLGSTTRAILAAPETSSQIASAQVP